MTIPPKCDAQCSAPFSHEEWCGMRDDIAAIKAALLGTLDHPRSGIASGLEEAKDAITHHAEDIEALKATTTELRTSIAEIQGPVKARQEETTKFKWILITAITTTLVSSLTTLLVSRLLHG